MTEYTTQVEPEIYNLNDDLASIDGAEGDGAATPRFNDPSFDFFLGAFESETGIDISGFPSRLDAFRVSGAIWSTYYFLSEIRKYMADPGAGESIFKKDSIGLSNQQFEPLLRKIAYANITTSTIGSWGTKARFLADQDENPTLYAMQVTQAVFDGMRLAARLASLMVDHNNAQFVERVRNWIAENSSLLVSAEDLYKIPAQGSLSDADYEKLLKQVNAAHDEYEKALNLARNSPDAGTVSKAFGDVLKAQQFHYEVTYPDLTAELERLNTQIAANATEKSGLNSAQISIARLFGTTLFGASADTLSDAVLRDYVLSADIEGSGLTAEKKTELLAMRADYMTLQGQVDTLDLDSSAKQAALAATQVELDRHVELESTIHQKVRENDLIWNSLEKDAKKAFGATDGLGIFSNGFGLGVVLNTPGAADTDKIGAGILTLGSFIEAFTTFAAMGHFSDTKLGPVKARGAYMLSSFASVTGAALFVPSVVKQLDNENLTDYQRDLLIAEITLQSTAVTTEMMNGALISLGAYYGAGSKIGQIALKWAPLLGAVTAVLSAFSPATWAYFRDKQARAAELSEKDTEAAAVLEDFLSDSVALEIGMHAGGAVIGVGAALLAMMATGPVGIGVAVVGGLVSALVGVFQQVALRNYAREVEESMRYDADGNPQTIAQFFENDFEEQLAALREELQESFDDLLADGDFNAIFHLGTAVASKEALDAATIARVGDEMDKSAQNYYGAYYGNGVWETLELSGDTTEGLKTLVLPDLDGGTAMILLTDPLSANATELRVTDETKRNAVTTLTLTDIAGHRIVDSGTNATVFNLSAVVNELKFKSGNTEHIEVVIEAGGGDDTFVGSSGSITFDGGAGLDVATYSIFDPYDGIDAASYVALAAGGTVSELGDTGKAGHAPGIRAYVENGAIIVDKRMAAGSKILKEITAENVYQNGKDVSTLEVRAIVQQTRLRDEYTRDVLTNIEVVQASKEDDHLDLHGDTSVVRISGFDGDDYLAGGHATRVILGGAGDDALDLSDSIRSMSRNPNLKFTDIAFVDGGEGRDEFVMDRAMQEMVRDRQSERNLDALLSQQFAQFITDGGDDGALAQTMAQQLWYAQDNPFIRTQSHDVEYVRFDLTHGASYESDTLRLDTLQVAPVLYNARMGYTKSSNGALLYGTESLDVFRYDGPVESEIRENLLIETITFDAGSQNIYTDDNYFRVAGDMYFEAGKTYVLRETTDDQFFFLLDGPTIEWADTTHNYHSQHVLSFETSGWHSIYAFAKNTIGWGYSRLEIRENELGSYRNFLSTGDGVTPFVDSGGSSQKLSVNDLTGNHIVDGRIDTYSGVGAIAPGDLRAYAQSHDADTSDSSFGALDLEIAEQTLYHVSGRVFLRNGHSLTIFENVDDQAAIYINGTLLRADGGWNTTTSGNYFASSTGFVDVDIYMRNHLGPGNAKITSSLFVDRSDLRTMELVDYIEPMLTGVNSGAPIDLNGLTHHMLVNAKADLFEDVTMESGGSVRDYIAWRTPTMEGLNIKDTSVELPDHSTLRITGAIYLEAGQTLVLRETVDDYADIYINGSRILANRAWNGSGEASYTATQTGFVNVGFYAHNIGGPGNTLFQTKLAGESSFGTPSFVTFEDPGREIGTPTMLHVTRDIYTGVDTQDPLALDDWAASHSPASSQAEGTSTQGYLNYREMLHYAGQVYLKAGDTIRIRERVDDHSLVKINGEVMLADDVHNNAAEVTWTADATGFHRIELFAHTDPVGGYYKFEIAADLDGEFTTIWAEGGAPDPVKDPDEHHLIDAQVSSYSNVTETNPANLDDWASTHEADSTADFKELFTHTQGANSMQHVSGKLFLYEGQTIQFFEMVDDYVMIAINGEMIHSNNSWNTHTFAQYTASATGTVDVDIYMKNTAGGSNHSVRTRLLEETSFQSITGHAPANEMDVAVARDIENATYALYDGATITDVSGFATWAAGQTALTRAQVDVLNPFAPAGTPVELVPMDPDDPDSALNLPGWETPDAREHEFNGPLAGHLNQYHMLHVSGTRAMVAGETITFRETVDDDTLILINGVELLADDQHLGHQEVSYTALTDRVVNIDIYLRNHAGPGSFNVEIKSRYPSSDLLPLVAFDDRPLEETRDDVLLIDATVSLYEGLQSADPAGFVTFTEETEAARTHALDGELFGALENLILMKAKGTLYLEAGQTVSFREFGQDGALIRVDGQTILSDAAWDVQSTGSYTASATGFVEVEFYAYNDAGGATEAYRFEMTQPGETEFHAVTGVLPHANSDAFSTVALTQVHDTDDRLATFTYHASEYNDLINNVLFDSTVDGYRTQNMTRFELAKGDLATTSASDLIAAGNVLGFAEASEEIGIGDYFGASYFNTETYYVGEIFLNVDTTYRFQDFLMGELWIAEPDEAFGDGNKVFGTDSVMPELLVPKAGLYRFMYRDPHTNFYIRSEDQPDLSGFKLQVKSSADSDVPYVDFDPGNGLGAHLDGAGVAEANGADGIVLLGDDFGEWLTGSSGDDIVFAAEGNDRIEGGVGHDLISGGGGADTILVGRSRGGIEASGHDVLLEIDGDDFQFTTFEVGRHYDGTVISAGDVDVYRRGNDLIITAGETDNSLTVAGYYGHLAAAVPFRILDQSGAQIFFGFGDVNAQDYSALSDRFRLSYEVEAAREARALANEQLAKIDSFFDGSYEDALMDQAAQDLTGILTAV